MNNWKFFFITIFLIFIKIIPSHISTIESYPESDLWINTTYQAEDFGIQYDKLPQCKAWNLWWKLQESEITPTVEIIDLLSTRKAQVSLNNVEKLIEYGLPKYLLSEYEFKTVHINFKKVCRNYSRYLLIDSLSEAKDHGINLSEICHNYEAKTKLSSAENDVNVESSSLIRKQDERSSSVIPSGGIRIINPSAVQIIFHESFDFEENTSMIVVRDQKTADFYKLGEISSVLKFHKGLKFHLEKVCFAEKYDIGNTGKKMENLRNLIEKDSNDEKVERDNLTIFFKRGIQLSSILNVFDSEMMSNLVPLPSSVLIPFVNRSHYDSRSPPNIFEGKIMEIFFGILIQSMSNFDQSTMDYDMDIWLRMAWHDHRLAHQFDRPILVNDENILKMIWRPSPFFQNAKEAEYHRMTMPNFWLYVFPNGEIFFETHLYLKPSCKLILCKYPHDKQMCSLKITAIASGQNSIRYNWFPRLNDAIRMHKLMESQDLYVHKYYKRYCDGMRKTGNFSCLEASCRLKRRLNYHMTRTYIPTATCVIFSWISVWLPEEFVTGRIFGSLTLFLTLSAESRSVKEVLPKVSYMKAIDLWFGFTSSFVFITMLEALIVISLEHKSRELRKKAEDGLDNICQYQIMLLMLKSSRYHSTARHIDKYCRTLYPIICLLFLIIYYFVITEGDETKCLQRINDNL